MFSALCGCSFAASMLLVYQCPLILTRKSECSTTLCEVESDSAIDVHIASLSSQALVGWPRMRG
eukprot:235962-Pleurochrysis_carterae.AAC.5